MLLLDDGRACRLAGQEGGALTLDALWLRDGCICPQCHHAASGQRLLDTFTIPAGIRLRRAELTADGFLALAWDDGHEGLLPPDRLTLVRLPTPRRLWNAHSLPAPSVASYESVRVGAGALGRWLAEVEETGVGLLQGARPVEGEVLRAAGLFGFVRETNYGRSFLVRTRVEPANLADTDLALGPHTDNPYRDPTPSLQLLHCLASSTAGGDTTLVDGFACADALRARSPAAFDLLARTPVRFRYRDATADLEARRPVIALDCTGQVAAVHYNTRSTQPFELRPTEVRPYYAAYRAFASLLVSREFQIELRLGAGDLLVMDNRRVLHGRTAMTSPGERLLEGCYADVDGLRSTRSVIEREEQHP